MSFYGPKTFGLEMESYKNLEIDNKHDMDLAEFFIRRLDEN